MFYIHAIQLINEAMKNDLLMGSANHVIVYREAGKKQKQAGTWKQRRV